MDEAPHAQLVRAAKAGDDGAFETLLGPLIQPGYRLACGMLHDAHAAEDVVQEAAVKAWKNLRGFRGTDLRPWFLRIVANQCRSLRRGRWATVLKIAAPERAIESPEDAAIRDADLRQAMRQLKPTQRLVLILYFYLDLPWPEIAAITGDSAAAVKGRLYRAVRLLRPNLEVPEVLT